MHGADRVHRSNSWRCHYDRPLIREIEQFLPLIVAPRPRGTPRSVWIAGPCERRPIRAHGLCLVCIIGVRWPWRRLQRLKNVVPLGRVFLRNLAMPFDAYLGRPADKPVFSRTL